MQAGYWEVTGCVLLDRWAFGVFTYEMLMGRSPFYNRSRTQMYERIVNEVCLMRPRGCSVMKV
jgi:serine/threonine protein kinase